MKKKQENPMDAVLALNAPRQQEKQDAIDPELGKKFYRPSRDGKKAITIHLEPGMAKMLKHLAIDEDSSVQKLTEEAYELLFIKKGIDLDSQ